MTDAEAAAERIADALKRAGATPVATSVKDGVPAEDTARLLDPEFVEALSRRRTVQQWRIDGQPPTTNLHHKGLPEIRLTYDASTTLVLNHHDVRIVRDRSDTRHDRVSIERALPDDGFGDDFETVVAHLANGLQNDAGSNDRASSQRIADLLWDAASAAAKTLLDNLDDAGARRRADDALHDALHARDMVDAMVSAIRPEGAHGIVLNLPKGEIKISSSSHAPSGFPGLRGSLIMFSEPVKPPEHVRALMPREPLLVAHAATKRTPSFSASQAIPGACMKTHVEVRFGHDLPPTTESPGRRDPMQAAALVREHGGDGSIYAAAMDAIPVPIVVTPLPTTGSKDPKTP